MSAPKGPDFFDTQRAAAYDRQYIKLAPLRDMIHLLIRIILTDLPEQARILCVGAGTGSELLDLAEAHPQWQFTAVEPSAPMLEVCRKRAEESGISSRCAFHQGYLDSLPASEPFDAVTCLLVSHFLTKLEQQHELFTQIASRLRPGGYLIHSALASDISTDNYQSLLDVWLHMQRYTGTPEESIAKLPSAYGRDVAILPPVQIESLIALSGFGPPVRFYQALLIHAWYAKRNSDSA